MQEKRSGPQFGLDLVFEGNRCTTNQYHAGGVYDLRKNCMPASGHAFELQAGGSRTFPIGFAIDRNLDQVASISSKIGL
jgi:hypothetical protein